MLPQRQVRLESLLKEEIAGILAHELKGIELGLTTVTRVRLTKDFRYVTVYLSFYQQDETSISRLMKKLAASSGFMRGLIGRRIRTHHVPEIIFKEDKSMEEANRIFELMKDIERESAQRNRSGPA